MDRLTERFSNGQAAVYGCGSKCRYDFKYCSDYLKDCPVINEIYERLAQYEDIGLTPEQLQQVDEMYMDRCREIAGLERKIKIVEGMSDWNALSKKGLPPIGKPLIVTIKDNLQGMPNQLRYPVYYVKDTMKNRYCWKWIYGDLVYDLLLDVSEVIAWIEMPVEYVEDEPKPH